MDNREGLVVGVRLTPADGASERDAALEMLEAVPGVRRITVGADRGYDTRVDSGRGQNRTLRGKAPVE
jgi:hypothetical protein